MVLLAVTVGLRESGCRFAGVSPNDVASRRHLHVLSFRAADSLLPQRLCRSWYLSNGKFRLVTAARRGTIRFCLQAAPITAGGRDECQEQPGNMLPFPAPLARTTALG